MYLMSRRKEKKNESRYNLDRHIYLSIYLIYSLTHSLRNQIIFIVVKFFFLLCLLSMTKIYLKTLPLSIFIFIMIIIYDFLLLLLLDFK